MHIPRLDIVCMVLDISRFVKNILSYLSDPATVWLGQAHPNSAPCFPGLDQILAARVLTIGVAAHIFSYKKTNVYY